MRPLTARACRHVSRGICRRRASTDGTDTAGGANSRGRPDLPGRDPVTPPAAESAGLGLQSVHSMRVTSRGVRGLPAIGQLMAAGLFVVVWLPIVLGARDLPSPTPDADPVDFARDVLPVLEAQCFECHGPQKARGRLRLDSRRAALKGGMTGPAIVPGDSEHSLLLRRVLGLDGEDRMPLDADPLPEDQIARLRAWIEQGAPWPGEDDTAAADADDEPQHWAYRPP